MNKKYNYEEIIEHYKKSKHQRKTAKHFGMDSQYLNKILKKHGIKNLHSSKGSNNPHWKSGKIFDGHGRKVFYMPEHPNPSFCKIYVYEYRLIMEKKLGRYLTSDEVVHHIDGDHTNNAIENLQIMSQSEHLKLHGGYWIKDKVVKNGI